MDSTGSGQRPVAEAGKSTLPPELEAALDHLRRDRPGAAARAATRFLGRAGPSDPDRSLAIEMLATARHLDGEPEGALAAWNRAGRPRVDLVRVDGLATLHHRAVAGALGVEARDTLTLERFRRARRRLEQLPGLAGSRLGYAVRRDGSVRLEATVVEHRRWPRPVEAALRAGASAALQDRVEVELGPFLPVGERWRLAGRWERASRAAELEVTLPWPAVGAVTRVAAMWRDEDLADGSSAERRGAALTLRRWVSSRLRGGATLGVERWRERGRLARMGVDALLVGFGGAARVGVQGDGWLGSPARFARLRAAVGWKVPRDEGVRSWEGVLGASLASVGAPPTVWDGAGTGRVRAPLLRGHELADRGRIGAGAMGRTLLHGTVSHVWTWRAGLASLGGAVFLDAAHVRDLLVGAGSRSYLSPGVELRLSSGGRVAAVALARGGGGWLLSGRVGRGSLPWLSAR